MSKKIQKIILKNKHHIVLVIILLISLIFRIYRITKVPPSLNQDEAVSGYDAYAISQTLKDHHGNFLPLMFKSFDDWTSPILTYITVPFVKTLGLSIFTIRLVVVLLGVGSVYLLFVFLKQLSININLALLASFLLAISPWSITLSRWAIPPSIVPFFLLLFLITFLWTVKIEKINKTRWQYLISAFTGAILVSTYPTQKLFAPIFIILIGLVYFRKNIKSLILFCTTFLLLISPVYLLSLLNPAYNTRFGDVSILSSQNIFKEFITRYFEYFLPYFHFYGSDPDIMHKVPNYGNSFLFLQYPFYLGIVITVLGLFNKIKIKKINKKTLLIFISWLLLFPVAASLTKDHNMVLRTIHGLPLVIVYSIFAFDYFFKYLSQDLRKVVVGIIILIGFIGLYQYSQVYYFEYSNQVYKNFQFGIKEYNTYLFENEDKFDQVIIDSKINRAYIFYLFFSKYNPNNLNYSNPDKSSNRYTFGDVTDHMIDNSKLIHSVRYMDTSTFNIYANDRNWYVKKMY